MKTFGKPDFIGVGQMKAGTDWLYRQLNSHPDLWLPPKKELHFFNNGFNFDSTKRRLDYLLLADEKDREEIHWEDRPPDPWHHRFKNNTNVQVVLEELKLEFEFYRRATTTMTARRLQKRANRIEDKTKRWRFNETELEWYSSLFCAPDKKCGEVTPAYAVLPKERIEQIVEMFPNTKFILNVRHPVERAISDLNHMVRNNAFKAKLTPRQIETDLGKIIEHELETKPIIEKSSVSKLVDGWIALAPKDRLHIISFDDIRDRPEHVLQSVADFLSIDKNLYAAPPDENRKAGNQKFRLPDKTIEILNEELKQETAVYEEYFSEGTKDLAS